jgi:hypothetical protein
VKPGVHVVEGRGPRRASSPRQVDVPLRDRAGLSLDLVERSGRVQIDTHTAEASIAIDGQPVARGVWEGTLPAGEHRLAVEAPGYRSHTRAFLVHEGETFVEDAPLVPNEPPVKYEGIYSGLAFLGFSQPAGPSNGILEACPGACQWSAPLGAGLAVRVGYAFGWLAIEGLALGSYDYSNTTVNGKAFPAGNAWAGPARNESYDFHRFGGGGAFGVRGATKDPHVRLTAALLGGLVTMGNIYKQVTSATDLSASNTRSSETVTYLAALLFAEAGVLVGFANGAKLHASVVMMTQFAGDPASAQGNTTAPFTTPPIGFARGAQVFVGPMVGFDFGL